MRTDAEFRRSMDQTEAELDAPAPNASNAPPPGPRGRAARERRSFFFVANGLALRMAMGDPLPDLDVIAQLVDEGVAPR